MKRIYVIAASLLLVFLAVSCNMDSQTGLFQEAGQSVKKESYVIRKVIAEESVSGSYLIASDEGIFVYDGGAGEKISTNVADGKTTRNVISASISLSGEEYTWECIYYSDPQTKGDGKYHIINQDGNDRVYSLLSGEKFIPVSSVYDGEKTVVVFRNSDSTKNYVYSSTSGDLSDEHIVDTGCTNVSFIGDSYFRGITADEEKKSVYFTFNGSTVSSKSVNTNSYTTHCGSVFLSKNTFYKEDGTALENGSVSGASYTRAVAYNDSVNRKVYFILSGVNGVYVIDTDPASENYMKVSTKNCASLSSVEVIHIDGVIDGEYINCITSESGAKCINLKDSRIDTSWKSAT